VDYLAAKRDANLHHRQNPKRERGGGDVHTGWPGGSADALYRGELSSRRNAAMGRPTVRSRGRAAATRCPDRGFSLCRPGRRYS
jgi:hypothetical protein